LHFFYNRFLAKANGPADLQVFVKTPFDPDEIGQANPAVAAELTQVEKRQS